MPTFPFSTGTTITNVAYNELSDIVLEVIGIGEDGYGLYDAWTTPITSSMPIRARSWDNLIRDLINNCYHHITNINTTTNSYASVLNNISTATTSTTISVDLHNRLKEVADFVLANRYTCAEEHYYQDPQTGAKIDFTGGVSQRTLPWGVTKRSITHVTRVRWANRLVARYFFNTGGYLTWQPYYTDGVNDTIDQDWSNFIDLVRLQMEDPAQEIRYDRAAFVGQLAGTTSTVANYTEGSLYMNVEVFKSSGADYVDFTVTFGNNATDLLVVTPSTGYWNEIV